MGRGEHSWWQNFRASFFYFWYKSVWKISWPHHSNFWNYGDFWWSPQIEDLYGKNTVLVTNTCNGCKIWAISDIHLILFQDPSFGKGIALIQIIFYISIVFIFSIVLHCLQTTEQKNTNKINTRVKAANIIMWIKSTAQTYNCKVSSY